MKVICAGAPKTGTKSIAKALRILGYKGVYDVEEAVEFAFEEWEDLYNGRTLNCKKLIKNAYSKGVEAVVDMPHSCFFDEFLEEWPKAKVILMLRETEAWYHSYKTMVEGARAKYGFYFWFLIFLSPATRRMYKWCEGMSKSCIGTVMPHEVLWKSWYKRHNCFVRNVVPSDQLLEFRVEEGWEPLCKFLGKPVPNEPFPCENQANSKHNITDRLMQDTWIAKKMIREAKIIVAIMIAFFLMIIIGIIVLLVKIL